MLRGGKKFILKHFPKGNPSTTRKWKKQRKNFTSLRHSRLVQKRIDEVRCETLAAVSGWEVVPASWCLSSKGPPAGRRTSHRGRTARCHTHWARRPRQPSRHSPAPCLENGMRENATFRQAGAKARPCGSSFYSPTPSFKLNKRNWFYVLVPQMITSVLLPYFPNKTIKKRLYGSLKTFPFDTEAQILLRPALNSIFIPWC